jgi:hypothetical protein
MKYVTSTTTDVMINKFYLLVDEVLDKDNFPRIINHVQYKYISLGVLKFGSSYLEILYSKTPKA